jgi:hypothetical protein
MGLPMVGNMGGKVLNNLSQNGGRVLSNLADVSTNPAASRMMGNMGDLLNNRAVQNTLNATATGVRTLGMSAPTVIAGKQVMDVFNQWNSGALGPDGKPIADAGDLISSVGNMFGSAYGAKAQMRANRNALNNPNAQGNPEFGVPTRQDPKMAPGEVKIDGYRNGMPVVRHGGDVDPATLKIHQDMAWQTGRDWNPMSRLGGALNPFNAGNPLNPLINRALGLPTATGPAAPRFGSRGYEFNMEDVKHRQMTESVLTRAQESRQQGDIEGANRLELQAQEFQMRSQAYIQIANDPTQRDLRGDNYIAARRAAITNAAEVKPLIGRKPSEVQLPERYRSVEVNPITGQPVDKPGTGVTVYGVLDSETGQLDRSQAILLVGDDGKLKHNKANSTASVSENPQLQLAGGRTVPSKDVIGAIDQVAGRFVDLKEPRDIRGMVPTDTESVLAAPKPNLDVREGSTGTTRPTGSQPSVTPPKVDAEVTPQLTRVQGSVPGTLNQEQGLPINAMVEIAPNSAFGLWPIPGQNMQRVIPGDRTGGHNYDHLKNTLADVNVGRALTSLLQTRTMPSDLNLTPKQKAAVEEAYGLLYFMEPSHPRGSNQHRRDLVYAEMVRDMLTTTDAKGKPLLEPKDMFDLLPATYADAQAGARRVTAEINDPDTKIPRDGTKVRAYRDERMLREQTLAQRYIELFGGGLPEGSGKTPIEDVADFLNTRFPQERFDSNNPSQS